MIKYKQAELDNIVIDHDLWLNSKKGGVKANLINVDLGGANLKGADLSGIDFSWANLSNANLRGANLTAANLSNTYLKNTDFRGAILTDVNLTGSDLTSAWGVQLNEHRKKQTVNTDNAINNYGQDMYNRGVAGGKSLGVSLLHLELLKHGLGTDAKFLDILNGLRAEFDEELNKTLEGK
tara:strand:- start:3218 stop:3757 length:540 start_codon:yes stop_codon:yes gene_type:complete